MKPTELFNKLQDLHLNRNYDSEDQELDLHSLIQFINFFPGEAFYVIDCKRAVMHKLTDNFKNIIGDHSDQTCDLFPLYNHVHDNQHEQFGAYTYKLIKRSVNDPSLWNSFDDCNKLIYKAKNGKTILKTTTAAKKDTHGCIIYTFGRLTDVSALVPSSKFRHHISGSHEKEHFAYFNGLYEYSGILGKREIEVLNFIGKGYSSKNIGEMLSISKNTVDTHRRNIIEKLEVNGCVKAYNKAVDMGII